MADLQLVNLETQIQNLSQQTQNQANQLGLHIADCDDEINDIKVQITGLHSDDDEIHDEIHTLSEAIDTNKSDIENLKSHSGEQDETLVTHFNRLNGLDTALEDMDDEHHEELHQLSKQIDSFEKKLNNVDVYTKEIPQYVIIDEESYANLKNPDTTKFYFVVEQEDLNPTD